MFAEQNHPDTSLDGNVFQKGLKGDYGGCVFTQAKMWASKEKTKQKKTTGNSTVLRKCALD